MKPLILSASLCLFAGGLYAQTPVVAAKPAPAVAAKPITPKKICTQPGLGIGLNLSSNGPGLDLAYTLNKRGNLILVAEWKSYSTSIKDYAFKISGQTLLINADIRVGHVGGFLDWHPFSNALKIKAGYAMVKTGVDVTAAPKDSTKQGIIMIAPSELGDIKSSITFKPSAYIGFGFGRAVPKKRVGFTMEFGAFHVGKPTVSFKTSGMLEPTSSQEPVLQNNMKFIKWLPVFNMSLNFRIGKLNK